MSWPGRMQRLRVPLGFALGAAYVALAPRPTPLTFGVGVSIALGGILVRAWAAGHIRKNDQLTTGGPYAHTRNPLYLGSFLVAAGVAVAAHWSMLLLVVAFFALVYAPTMRQERRDMLMRFPGDFPSYERNVPPFVPRARPWRARDGGRETFSVRLYMRHREWQAGLAFLLAVLWLALRLRRVL